MATPVTPELVQAVVEAAPHAEAAKESVLGALGVNWKLFIAQLLNFSVVLFIMWKWVYTPLLKAIDPSAERSRVLLIDEIDRSDEEFEAFLLELLSDFQITIPEIGTIQAKRKPIVVITSNRTREVHDALKRRCLYFWIDYPTFQKELEIVRTKLPGASEKLSSQVTRFVQELRQMELYKIPGIAETLDWVATLNVLGRKELDPQTVEDTLGAVIKERDDLETVLVRLEEVAADG